MEKLTLVKVGGKIVEEPDTLEALLHDFKQIAGYKLLVHGGGRLATDLSERLGIETKMVEGRRITDSETIKVVTMVYAGLVNKTIVARLQALDVNAMGLCGADINLIRSHKRPVKDIDYGFVGDVEEVQPDVLADLIDQNIVPVVAPITHDGHGLLLNTNADTIAGEVAKALATRFDVQLIFCLAFSLQVSFPLSSSLIAVPQHRKNRYGTAVATENGNGPSSVAPVSSTPAATHIRYTVPLSRSISSIIETARFPQMISSAIQISSPIRPSLRKTSRNMLCAKVIIMSWRPSYAFNPSTLRTEMPNSARRGFLQISSRLRFQSMLRSSSVSMSATLRSYTRATLSSICRSWVSFAAALAFLSLAPISMFSPSESFFPGTTQE